MRIDGHPVIHCIRRSLVKYHLRHTSVTRITSVVVLAQSRERAQGYRFSSLLFSVIPTLPHPYRLSYMAYG